MSGLDSAAQATGEMEEGERQRVSTQIVHQSKAEGGREGGRGREGEGGKVRGERRVGGRITCC